jgi:8-oxo-dGTP pyrophosphatase MutT (NUDIX family)
MTVTAVEQLDLRFAPARWAFAEARRADIDALFAARQRANPRLWNGRVLMLHRYRIEAGVLHGAFLETDYASLNSWLAWGRPAADIWDCFGSAAVLSSDGAFLLGQMAAHTANAGRVYFPCGTPDLSDVKDGVVDFDHSIGRELMEETGLDAASFAAERGWTIVEAPARLVAFKVLRARESADQLRQRVDAHLARHPNGELEAIRFVRSSDQLDATVPDYVTTFLDHRWRHQTPGSSR